MKFVFALCLLQYRVWLILWGDNKKKKGFLKYFNSKKRTKEDIGPLLDEVGHLVDRGEDKIETFHAFTPVFNTGDGPWEPLALGWRTTTGGVVSSQLTLDLYGICCSNCMYVNLQVPMGFIPGYWESFADVRPYQGSRDSGEVPDNWKLANVIPISKKGKKDDPGNYRPVGLASVPVEIMEVVILGGIGKTLERRCSHRSKPTWVQEGKVMSS